jgi:hypothetical protein
MFLPLNISTLAEKASTKGDGRSFKLTRHQRIRLLEIRSSVGSPGYFQGSPARKYERYVLISSRVRQSCRQARVVLSTQSFSEPMAHTAESGGPSGRPGIGYIVFIPKGSHSATGDQVMISSTHVRDLFFSKQGDRKSFRKQAAKMVLISDLLAICVGIHECWTARGKVEDWDWKRCSVSEVAKDDLTLMTSSVVNPKEKTRQSSL